MKKIVSVVLVASMLTVMQVYAKDDSKMSYDQGKEILQQSSRTIKKLDLSERKAFYQYNRAVQGTKSLNTDGTTQDTPMGKITITYPADIQVLLTKQKVLYPLQMKYLWNMTNNRKLVTEKALYLGLRDLYLGFIKSDRDYDMSLKKLDLAKKKYDVSKLRYDQGLISKIELGEAEYNYLKAQKDVYANKRSRENMQRTINSYIGAPIDTVYEKVLYSELSRDLTLKSVEYYLEKALKERLEITSLMEDIKIKEKNLDILKKNRANEIYTDYRKEYNNVSRELEGLKIKLEKAKLDVENNIKGAYIDVKKEGYNVDSMIETLNMQRRSFEKLKTQYSQGLIPKITIDEVELGLQELQNGFDLILYSYNTKIMKLEEAAGLGPAY